MSPTRIHCYMPSKTSLLIDSSDSVTVNMPCKCVVSIVCFLLSDNWANCEEIVETCDVHKVVMIFDTCAKWTWVVSETKSVDFG